jgi:hypothetical protein
MRWYILNPSCDEDYAVVGRHPLLLWCEVNILVLGRTYDPILETVMHAPVSYDLAVTICYLILYLPLIFLC